MDFSTATQSCLQIFPRQFFFLWFNLSWTSILVMIDESNRKTAIQPSYHLIHPCIHHLYFFLQSYVIPKHVQITHYSQESRAQGGHGFTSLEPTFLVSMATPRLWSLYCTSKSLVPARRVCGWTYRRWARQMDALCFFGGMGRVYWFWCSFGMLFLGWQSDFQSKNAMGLGVFLVLPWHLSSFRSKVGYIHSTSPMDMKFIDAKMLMFIEATEPFDACFVP